MTPIDIDVNTGFVFTGLLTLEVIDITIQQALCFAGQVATLLVNLGRDIFEMPRVNQMVFRFGQRATGVVAEADAILVIEASLSLGDVGSHALAGTPDLICQIPLFFLGQERNNFTMHEQHQLVCLLPYLQILKTFTHRHNLRPSGVGLIPDP